MGHASIRRRGALAALTLIGSLFVAAPALAGPTWTESRGFNEFWAQNFQIDADQVGVRQGTVAKPNMAAGDHASMRFCNPYDQATTRIVGAGGGVVRWHDDAVVARVEFGPSADGSGGLSVPDNTLAKGVGRGLGLEGTSAQCITGRVRQTGAQSGRSRAVWSLWLNSVTFEDLQGPAVSTPALSGPSRNGWFNGAVTATWSSTDNAHFRGLTGMGTGSSFWYNGDPGNGGTSMAIPDALADGETPLFSFRSAPGWEAAFSAPVTLRRDRGGPEIGSPTVTRRGGEQTVNFTLVDRLSGPETSWVELSTDEGWLLLPGSSLPAGETRSPMAQRADWAAFGEGAYPWRVGARDLAGNVSYRNGQGAFVLDRTPPALEQPSLTASGSDLLFQARISDASGLAGQVILEANEAADGGTGGRWIRQASAPASSPLRVSFRPVGLKAGRHAVRVLAQDGFGNEGAVILAQGIVIDGAGSTGTGPVTASRVRLVAAVGRATTVRLAGRPRSVTIKGRLLRAGKPVVGARIRARGAGAKGVVKTDKAGRYRLRVRVTKPGVVRISAAVKGSPQARIRVRA